MKPDDDKALERDSKRKLNFIFTHPFITGRPQMGLKEDRMISLKINVFMKRTRLCNY